MPSIPSATTSGAGTVANYEIVSGDSLSQISNKVYGDSKHWNLIYEANKKVIGEDPANLVVGTKLTIPAKPQSGATATPATKPVASPVVPRAPITTPAAKPATGSTSTGGAGGSSAPMSTPSTTAPIPTPPISTPPVTTPGKPS
jgi:LysM repeat protein